MKRFLRFISALLVAITALSAVSCNSVAKLEDSGKENAEGITVKSEMAVKSAVLRSRFQLLRSRALSALLSW